MDDNHLLDQFSDISVWKRGGQRAPHKPLLILFALSQCVNFQRRLIPFPEVDEKLKRLLLNFGPSRKSYHPEYPFWRLQNDGIWELTNTERVRPRKSNTDARRTDLIESNVSGGFNQAVFDTLSKDHELANQVAELLLNKHFPASIHDDILQSVGLDFENYSIAKRQKRDPQFRENVLRAYEYQCAVCGLNIRVGHSPIALESAHIKWKQAGGPDSENNGIALCTLHHKLFDRGAYTLSDDLCVHVSDRANGTNGFNEWLMKYHGQAIRTPQRPDFKPSGPFMSWHKREVFQGGVRHL